jgi:hypothetical protein
MDEIIEKWAQARTAHQEWGEKMEHYRKQAEEQMARMNVSSYETDRYRVKKQVQQRSVMSKKMVPAEVWDRYALPQRVEFLILTSIKK